MPPNVGTVHDTSTAPGVVVDVATVSPVGSMSRRLAAVVWV